MDLLETPLQSHPLPTTLIKEPTLCWGVSACVAAHARAGTHAAGGRRTQAASTTRLSGTDQQLVLISQNEHELHLSGQPEQEIHISSFGTLTKVNDRLLYGLHKASVLQQFPHEDPEVPAPQGLDCGM